MPKESFIMPGTTTSDLVFSTEDPEVIQRYLEQEAHHVKRLSAERRKAEWEEVRDYKATVARDNHKSMLDDIERYRADSRRQWRDKSLSRLTREKESHEHNSSVLEYKRLFRETQETANRQLGIDDKALVKWSRGKASPLRSQATANRSHSRSQLDCDLSPEEQTRVKSKIMELKQLHKQLQEKSYNEQRVLTMLRGSN
jgi:hypothetical protein